MGTNEPEDADDPAADAADADGKPAAGIPALIQRIMKLRPVRVFQHFGTSGGGLLAAGLSFQAIFAVFAAIWVGFTVAGFVIKSHPALQVAIFDSIEHSVPGLIGEDAAIDPSLLLQATVLGWTGAIALAGMIVTTLGWFASARDAIRRIFRLPGDTTFILLLKLKDFGFVIGFGAALIVSAAISAGSTSALGALFDLAGIHNESVAAIVAARVIGLLIVFAFDTVVLAMFYRVLAGAHIPIRRLVAGAVIGAVGLGVLKALGSALLGGASRNPLLASFAIIIGLLIWFNLICQVILLAASWIAVGMSDAGIEARRLSPEQAASEARAREARARLVIAAAERTRLERELQDARGFRRRRLAKKLKHAAAAETNARSAAEKAGSESTVGALQ